MSDRAAQLLLTESFLFVLEWNNASLRRVDASER
jgi:hypothetical protein